MNILEKMGGANNPEDPSYEFLKILNMGSISSRKHEIKTLEILEYDINIFEKHEIEIGSYGVNIYHKA